MRRTRRIARGAALLGFGALLNCMFAAIGVLGHIDPWQWSTAQIGAHRNCRWPMVVPAHWPTRPSSSIDVHRFARKDTRFSEHRPYGYMIIRKAVGFPFKTSEGFIVIEPPVASGGSQTINLKCLLVVNARGGSIEVPWRVRPAETSLNIAIFALCLGGSRALVICLRRYVRRRHRRCPDCGYPGTPGRCPECGVNVC